MTTGASACTKAASTKVISETPDYASITTSAIENLASSVANHAEAVVFTLRVALDLVQFSQLRSQYIAAIAATASVNSSSITILSLFAAKGIQLRYTILIKRIYSAGSGESKWNLMGAPVSNSSVDVLTSVMVPPWSTWSSVINSLSLDMINRNLQKYNIPEAIFTQAPSVTNQITVGAHTSLGVPTFGLFWTSWLLMMACIMIVLLLVWIH